MSCPVVVLWMSCGKVLRLHCGPSGFLKNAAVHFRCLKLPFGVSLGRIFFDPCIADFPVTFWLAGSLLAWLARSWAGWLASWLAVFHVHTDAQIHTFTTTLL